MQPAYVGLVVGLACLCYIVRVVLRTRDPGRPNAADPYDMGSYLVGPCMRCGVNHLGLGPLYITERRGVYRIDPGTPIVCPPCYCAMAGINPKAWGPHDFPDELPAEAAKLPPRPPQGGSGTASPQGRKTPRGGSGTSRSTVGPKGGTGTPPKSDPPLLLDGVIVDIKPIGKNPREADWRKHPPGDDGVTRPVPDPGARGPGRVHIDPDVPACVTCEAWGADLIESMRDGKPTGKFFCPQCVKKISENFS